MEKFLTTQEFGNIPIRYNKSYGNEIKRIKTKDGYISIRFDTMLCSPFGVLLDNNYNVMEVENE